MNYIELILSFAVNIISGIILIIIVDKYNKSNVKRKFIEDFRTNELISEGLSFEYMFFYVMIDQYEFKVLIRDDSAIKKTRVRKKIFKWFSEEKGTIKLLIDCIRLDKNEILYDMIDHSFIIFNNFKLMNIKNNLKNRISNFNKDNLLEEIDSTENPINKYNRIKYLMLDLMYYYQYFNELIDEINYIENTVKKHKKFEKDVNKMILSKKIIILTDGKDLFKRQVKSLINELNEYKKMFAEVKTIQTYKKAKNKSRYYNF